MPIARPSRKQRALYLTDSDYTHFAAAALHNGMNFNEWARLALHERYTKDARSMPLAEKSAPVETYKGPNGWVWEKNLQCWCGECHDPFATHGENTMEMDVEGRHAPKLGAKPCNVETSSL